MANRKHQKRQLRRLVERKRRRAALSGPCPECGYAGNDQDPSPIRVQIVDQATGLRLDDGQPVCPTCVERCEWLPDNVYGGPGIIAMYAVDGSDDGPDGEGPDDSPGPNYPEAA